jgi:hypothetical protein
MGAKASVVSYVLVLVAVVVGADVLFLSHRFLERLIVNIGIVLVFALVYFAIQRRRESR